LALAAFPRLGLEQCSTLGFQGRSRVFAHVGGRGKGRSQSHPSPRWQVPCFVSVAEAGQDLGRGMTWYEVCTTYRQSGMKGGSDVGSKTYQRVTGLHARALSSPHPLPRLHRSRDGGGPAREWKTDG